MARKTNNSKKDNPSKKDKASIKDPGLTLVERSKSRTSEPTKKPTADQPHGGISPKMHQEEENNSPNNSTMEDDDPKTDPEVPLREMSPGNSSSASTAAELNSAEHQEPKIDPQALSKSDTHSSEGADGKENSSNGDAAEDNAPATQTTKNTTSQNTGSATARDTNTSNSNDGSDGTNNTRDGNGGSYGENSPAQDEAGDSDMVSAASATDKHVQNLEHAPDHESNGGGEGWKVVGSSKGKQTVSKTNTQPKGTSPGTPEGIQQKADTTFGIRVIREGETGATAYNPINLWEIFHHIQVIDPKLKVRNHANDPASQMDIAELANGKLQDPQGYLDIQRTTWGSNTDNKERTVLSFWVTSVVITPSLQELRNHKPMKDTLALGKCRVSSHSLHQSMTRVVGYLIGKDHRHTNRSEAASRILKHLQFHGISTPVQATVAPVIDESKHAVLMVAIVVGEGKARLVANKLEDNPSPDYEMMMHSWIRSAPDAVMEKLEEHKKLVSHSRAIKIIHLTSYQLVTLRKKHSLSTEMRTAIVDIPTAAHFGSTGTTYIQYLKDDKINVRSWVDKTLANLPEDKHFTQRPSIVTPLDSNATITTAGNTAGTKATKIIPPGRFSSKLAHISKPPANVVFSTRAPRQKVLPEVVNRQAKTFLEAAKQPPPPAVPPNAEVSDIPPNEEASASSVSEDDDDITLPSGNTGNDSSIPSSTRSKRSTVSMKEFKAMAKEKNDLALQVQTLTAQMAAMQQQLDNMLILQGQNMRAHQQPQNAGGMRKSMYDIGKGAAQLLGGAGRKRNTTSRDSTARGVGMGRGGGIGVEPPTKRSPTQKNSTEVQGQFSDGLATIQDDRDPPLQTPVNPIAQTPDQSKVAGADQNV